MKYLVSVALIGMTLLGCKYENSSCGVAYFGGEIINPSNGHLVLYDTNEPVDTLYLDSDNRFFYTFENLSPGLYSFVHGGEYQVVLLEPNDSVMIRLNTFDFDESLVYTGRGSRKNNFLIELFIDLEEEDKMMYDLGDLDPTSFQDTLVSLANMHHEKLNAFLAKHSSSETFIKISRASIDYSMYARKELYPFRYYNSKEIRNKEGLPENFFAYRSEIDYNNSDLRDFYPFYNFLFPHIDNLALDSYFDHNKDITYFNRSDLNYNLYKLEVIDSLIKDEGIKNNLLKYKTRNYLAYNVTYDESQQMYVSFMEKCNNKDDIAYIKDLNDVLITLQPGNVFPEIKLVDANDDVIPISTLFDKPTVVYFWSKSIKSHFKNSHKKVEELRVLYPNINFVSININSENTDVWKRLLRQNNCDLKGEYRFLYPDESKKALAINYINKVMIVGTNHNIIKSNAQMFDWEFNKELDAL